MAKAGGGWFLLLRHPAPGEEEITGILDEKSHRNTVHSWDEVSGVEAGVTQHAVQSIQKCN